MGDTNYALVITDFMVKTHSLVITECAIEYLTDCLKLYPNMGIHPNMKKIRVYKISSENALLDYQKSEGATSKKGILFFFHHERSQDRNNFIENVGRPRHIAASTETTVLKEKQRCTNRESHDMANSGSSPTLKQKANAGLLSN